MSSRRLSWPNVFTHSWTILQDGLNDIDEMLRPTAQQHYYTMKEIVMDLEKNPCTEIDMSTFDSGTGDVKTMVTKRAIEAVLSTGQSVLLIAPTGRAAAELRHHLADAGYPVKPYSEMQSDEVAVCIETIDNLRAPATIHSTSTATGRDFRDEGFITVIDDFGAVYQTQLDALPPVDDAGMWPGKQDGVSDAFDSLFNDETIVRERRHRSTYVLTDDRPLMRDLTIRVLKATMPIAGYDPARENQEFNRRNSRRGNTSRGRHRR